MTNSGIVTHTTVCTAPTRVVALTDHRVLAEVPVGADGRWRLETDAQPIWIVAQCRETAVAAAAAKPAVAAHLELPELVELELEQESTETTLTVWVDPVELIGFPHDLIWSLFAQPDQVVELHVAELELSRGKRVTIPVQRGRFRLSGGTVALRPSFGADPVQLASVTNVVTRTRIESQAGQAIVDVQGPARYRLDFETYR